MRITHLGIAVAHAADTSAPTANQPGVSHDSVASSGGSVTQGPVGDSGASAARCSGTAAFLAWSQRSQLHTAGTLPPTGEAHAAESESAMQDLQNQLAQLNLDAGPSSADAPDRNQAAAKIQAAWHGYTWRKHFGMRLRGATPYPNRAFYLIATYSYAPALLRQRPIGSNLRTAEYGVYASVASIPYQQPALLHSQQRPRDLDAMRIAYNGSLHERAWNI